MGKSRVKGIVVEIGGDTMGLDKALDGTNKKIGTTQSKLKDVERLLKLDPNNTVLLEQKQKLLAQAVADTEQKLNALNDANDQVKESVKNYDAWKAAYDPIQTEIDATKKKLKELKDQQTEMADCGEIDTDAYKQLTQEIENTNKELRDLKKEAKAVNDEFGNPVSPDQYDALQREIVETKNDLKSLVDKAEETARKINNVDEKPIEEVEHAAEDAANALGKASREASTFGDVLKAEAIVEGAKGIMSWAKGAAESTQEYRKGMAQLEVSSEAAGYSAEQTREAYNALYSVLGDNQSAMTAVANLQALKLPQEELLSLIDNVIGAWAKYGDSIPIEGLTEAINETVKTGKVTGTLADVLNWGTQEGEKFGVQLKQNLNLQEKLVLAEQEASVNSEEYIEILKKKLDAQYDYSLSARESANVAQLEKAAKLEATMVQQMEKAALEVLTGEKEKSTDVTKKSTDANEAYNKSVEAASTAEDYFNIALNERNSETERASFLLDTLANQGLASMTQKLRENNSTMIEANQASADWQEQLAILGEEIEPLMTELLQMATELLRGFNELDPGTQKLVINLVALVAAIGPLGTAINGASKILGLFKKDGLSGVISVLDSLTGNTLPATTTSFDKATGHWVTKLDTSTATVATGILPKLQNAFSTTFSFIASNPIVLLIGAIVGLVALVATKGDEIQNVLQTVDDYLQDIFATDWTTIFGPVLGDAMNGFFQQLKNIWDSVKQILDGVIDFIRGVFTGDWERAWRGVSSIIEGIFNGLVNIVRVPINGIIGMVNGIISACNLAIDALNKLPGVEIQQIQKIAYWESNGGSAVPSASENDVTYALLDDRRADRAESRTYSTSNTFTGDINVYAAEGQSEEETANLVMEAIQRHYESAEAGLS